MILRQHLPLTLVLCVLALLPGASAQIRSWPIAAWPHVPIQAPFTPRNASPAVSARQARQIASNIYEYDWIVPTSAGQYHSIGVHRVVQVVNGKPIASHNAVLLAHGDAGNFNAHFMAGTYSPKSPTRLSGEQWRRRLGHRLRLGTGARQRDQFHLYAELGPAAGFRRPCHTARQDAGSPRACGGALYSRGSSFGYANSTFSRLFSSTARTASRRLSREGTADSLCCYATLLLAAGFAHGGQQGDRL